ncbi:MAG: response regulator [Armatimonadetes bacterium]|nr:response regulator [Armatimonadota bacterium]
MNAKGKILVVDDERGMREGCRRILVPEGYAVDMAADGEEAIRRLREDGYDMMLLDLKMPGIGGMDVIEPARKADPDLSIIVMTGYATLESAVEATKRGIYDYIAKPFAPDELLPVVTRGMETRRLMVESRRLREERDRNLLELAAEKSRIHTVVNCMADGALVINREGQLVLYNPAAAHLLRLSASPPLEAPIAEALPCPALVGWLEESQGETEFRRVSRELSVGEGPEATVLMVNIAPVRDEAGLFLGSVAILRDITRLKEIDRMKSQFVSMVSHELRSPLAAVEGYLDVLLSGLIAHDPERARRMMHRARERTDSLLHLVDDLLQVSRMESGRIRRNLAPVALGDLAKEAVLFFEEEAQKKEVRLTAEIPESLPAVLADKDEITRLLTNLISNAIKYNRPGGSVTARLSQEASFLRLDMEDTGLGIAEEDLPRLFTEFHRIKRPETLQVTGTGLGLSIVKRIVDAHHGRLEVRSRLNEGSVFSVFLPL